MKPDHRLAIILWVIALHSLSVGLAMCILPSASLVSLGFVNAGDRFFPIQGGVFHGVMAVAYGMAARDVNRQRSLILFAIVAKFIATLFLLAYYLFGAHVTLVLLSCCLDAAMGILLLLGLHSLDRSRARAEAGAA